MGIHEGPCLAVTLNEQQDYFGQTVNIASRVQGLAASRAIVATEQVVENAQASAFLKADGLKPALRHEALRGIADERSVYWNSMKGAGHCRPRARCMKQHRVEGGPESFAPQLDSPVLITRPKCRRGQVNAEQDEGVAPKN